VDDRGSEISGETLAHHRPERQRSPQERARQTVRRLIDVTVEILVAEGADAVTIGRVMRETGLSRGAIYHHFSDRDALVRAAQFDRLTRQPLGDIDALRAAVRAAETREDFIAVVGFLALALCDPARHSVRAVRAGVIASSASHPDLEQALRRLETSIADDLADVVREGQSRAFITRDIDAAAIGALIEAVAFGLLLVDFMDHQPDADALATAVSRAFLAFLGDAP
jgi:AcrR family transcriptional regulator